jgi:ABC-type multidrug transport system fused ATPase/permease subunit
MNQIRNKQAIDLAVQHYWKVSLKNWKTMFPGLFLAAIVVAHRLSTIQHIGRIVVMENGKIVEQGSHKELLRKKGAYADLWGHQSGGFIND